MDGQTDRQTDRQTELPYRSKLRRQGKEKERREGGNGELKKEFTNIEIEYLIAIHYPTPCCDGSEDRRKDKNNCKFKIKIHSK